MKSLSKNIITFNYLCKAEILVILDSQSLVSIIFYPTKVMRHQGLMGLCFLVEVNHTDLSDPSLHRTQSHSRLIWSSDGSVPLYLQQS